MQIIYDPSDTLDMADFGIDIPISFNNARKSMEEFFFQHRVTAAPESMRPTLLPWYHNTLSAAPDSKELSAVHDSAFIKRLLDGGDSLEAEVIRTYELLDEKGNFHRYNPDEATRPLSELFDILRKRGGGVIKAAELAFSKGEAWYFGGGFHHAHWDYGSGFCLYNDTLVARQRFVSDGKAPLTWIIDIDAHKGDGTADLVHRMNENGDNSVIALSIHMGNGWPLDEKRNVPGYEYDPAWVGSDIDIPVFEGEENEYNSRLLAGLEQLELLSKKNWGRKKPELVFVVAGADPFEEDMLPSTSLIKMSRTQMLERNILVRNFLKERELPSAYLQAGNYGDHSWKTFVDFLGPIAG